MKKNIKAIFGGDFRQFAMIFALIIIALFFQWQTGGKVFQSQNLMNLVMTNAYVLVLAMGMVLVIIAGSIDLSVGSVAAVVGIVVAIMTTNHGLNPWLGILLGIAVGLLIGAWQGFWVGIWGIPAFVVTLAGMMLFRGMNQAIGNSMSVPVPQLYTTLGAGYLPDFGPFNFNMWTMILATVAVLALVWNEFKSRRQQAEVEADLPPVWVPITRLVVLGAVIFGIMWIFATGRPGTSFPIPGLIAVVLALVYSFISNRTVIGRSVYAVGGNRAAAELTGVQVKRTNFFIMINMAFLSAIAGILFIGRATSSGPADGNLWEMDAISSVFIGGAAVAGGVGTIMGTMVGALVIAFLNNGLQLMGVGADWTQMIKGLVLLIAVAVDVYSKRQGRRSVIGMFQNARRNQREIRETEKAVAEGKVDDAVAAADRASAPGTETVFTQTPGGTPKQE
ncbi:sugar ABC transporter permease [Schaalia naturae]|jgi:putative multiple sugar transport system permease protein|uniref:Xylose transport system permease protein XylH n=1 Tax=Schaalia naturae TaxID=635203 RepID=A0ABW2SMX4_9ACTO